MYIKECSMISCEPQRTDQENRIYLVLRVSCYQSSTK